MWKHSLSLSADTSLCQSMKQFSVEDKELLSRVWWYEAGKTVPLKAKRAPPWRRERLPLSRGTAWSFWGEEQRGESEDNPQSWALTPTCPCCPASVQSQSACWHTGRQQGFLLWCALLESKNLILAVFVLWAISTVPETEWAPNKGLIIKRMTEWMDWRMDGWTDGWGFSFLHPFSGSSLSILSVLSLFSQGQNLQI